MNPAWISNHISVNEIWDRITYPFPNFNGWPLKFGNGWIISPSLYNGFNYVCMLGSKLIQLRLFPQDWSLRLLLERSRAIKCPTIQYFLAGMKKVQQMVASPGVVEQYLSDPKAIQRPSRGFIVSMRCVNVKWFLPKLQIIVFHA